MYKDYRPIHSDFIIHWTGKDIDNLYDNNWINDHNSITNDNSTLEYIKRLKNILEYGLWMTEDTNDENLQTINGKLNCPKHSRTCFTELKLSMARAHAAEYGRLGIGFKRFFLFDRLGAPMIYYSKDRNHWLQPPLIENNPENIENYYYRCFLKPMTEKTENGLHYKYYDESEWRIIYSEKIKEKLSQTPNLKSINNYFCEPSSIDDINFKNEITKSKNKPKYFIPIKDEWFAMIIYPSIEVKVRAQSDPEIRDLISKIKPSFDTSAMKERHKPKVWERYNLPIEIDLDTCRNF